MWRRLSILKAQKYLLTPVFFIFGFPALIIDLPIMFILASISLNAIPAELYNMLFIILAILGAALLSAAIPCLIFSLLPAFTAHVLITVGSLLTYGYLGLLSCVYAKHIWESSSKELAHLNTYIYLLEQEPHLEVKPDYIHAAPSIKVVAASTLQSQAADSANDSEQLISFSPASSIKISS